MSNQIKFNTREKSLSQNVDGATYTAPYGWFRGRDMKFYPNKESICNPKKLIENFVGLDYLKSVNFSTKDQITAIGSCFASNFSKWFSEKYYINKSNKNSYIIRFNEGFVNTYSILQQFEWALENKIPKTSLWFDAQNNILEYNEEIRIRTREILLDTEIFIITLGLSEVCYNKQNGDVFWRAVPKKKFDSSIHGFRLTSVEENMLNLNKLVELNNNYNKNAKIIFTLSPIPLIASFRQMPVIQSSLVSKSILRTAIDSVLSQNNHPSLYYWPSYEIINTLFSDAYMDDARHIKKSILEFNMVLFDYCLTNSIPFEEVEDSLFLAR